MGFPADGHLPLLHGFQQGALNFGRGAVDLVGQHEVGKHRTLLDGKLLVLLVVHQGANDVGREQVRGELHPREIAGNRVAQAFDGQGFGQSRHPFQKHVPVGQKTNQQTVHHARLPHNGAAHLGSDQLHELALGRDVCVQGLDVWRSRSSGLLRFHQFHDSRRYRRRARMGKGVLKIV